MANSELLTGFKFIVSIETLQMGFRRVSGVSRQIDTEVYREGGVNDRVHVFIKQASSSATLTLEKGVCAADNHPFYLVGEPLKKPLVLTILNAANKSSKTYTFTGCIVKKWSISDLNAEDNMLLLDTFELEYSEVDIE